MRASKPEESRWWCQKPGPCRRMLIPATRYITVLHRRSVDGVVGLNVGGSAHHRCHRDCFHWHPRCSTTETVLVPPLSVERFNHVARRPALCLASGRRPVEFDRPFVPTATVCTVLAIKAVGTSGTPSSVEWSSLSAGLENGPIPAPCWSPPPGSEAWFPRATTRVAVLDGGVVGSGCGSSPNIQSTASLPSLEDSNGVYGDRGRSLDPQPGPRSKSG